MKPLLEPRLSTGNHHGFYHHKQTYSVLDVFTGWSIPEKGFLAIQLKCFSSKIGKINPESYHLSIPNLKLYSEYPDSSKLQYVIFSCEWYTAFPILYVVTCQLLPVKV